MVRKVLMCVSFPKGGGLKKHLKSLGFQPFFVIFQEREKKNAFWSREKRERKKEARARIAFDI
jgi:hypothetical protein